MKLILGKGFMTHRYNLILLHVPGKQGISDFLTIRNMMVGWAPDIEVHIASLATKINVSFWQKAAERPTLIFSPTALRIDHAGVPIRGARLMSKPLDKLGEIAVLTGAGSPVPDTRLISPDLKLDAADWGPFTVVKPNHGKQGQGVRLARTRDVRWTDTQALPKDDPRHGHDLLAQRFVDTGPFTTCYRVFMVLGRPIYCMRSRAVEKRPELDTSDALDTAVAANGVARILSLLDDDEIVDLAKAIHARLPHLPVLGLDIIREHDTGRLFVLEFNSAGGVWHLSSDYGQGHQREHGLDYYGQFNALGSIAGALITATRERAI